MAETIPVPIPDQLVPITQETIPKPGYQTTEFWLSAAAKLLGLLFASGVLGDGSIGMRIAGLAATVLAALGYTVSRSMVKMAGVFLLFGLLGSTQMSCGASQRETAIKTSLVAADAARDAFLAYDGPHELELARSGPPTPEGKAQAAAALAAYQAKRSATVDRAMIAAYRAIAVFVVLNDQPSLDGVQAAIAQVKAAYQALKGTTP